MSQADDAEKVPLENRLAKYSFIARHKGNIHSPKILKKTDIKKYQKQFKKRFNVDFPLESSESDDDTNLKTKSDRKKNNNVIILGTPKRAKRESAIPKKTVIQKVVDMTTNEHDDTIPNNSEPQYSNTADTDKPANSMVVQVGSTAADSIDNGKYNSP